MNWRWQLICRNKFRNMLLIKNNNIHAYLVYMQIEPQVRFGAIESYPEPSFWGYFGQTFFSHSSPGRGR